METLRFLMVSTFYPPHHLGGDAVHVQHLAEALAAQGHEVHVEYSPAAYEVKRPLSEMPATPSSGKVQVHPMTRPAQVSSPLAAYLLGESRAVSRAHEKLVRQVRPDVIHLHNVSLLGLGVQRGSDGRPLLYTAHDYWFRCPRSDLLKGGRVPCERPTCFSCMVGSRRPPALWRPTDIALRMNGIRCVIAPSEFMRNLAASSFGCPVIHIPNFVPDENPSGRVESGSRYYIYVGVLERHKGVPELAEATRQSSGDSRFILVGRGSLERSLRASALRHSSRLEIQSGVDQDGLASLLKHAAGFLMPSIWYENAPLAAIEALAWGCPLLVTSRGGAPELTHGRTAGLEFEPGVPGILDAIRAFEHLEDPASLRRGARMAYETHHRPETYLNRYLSVVRPLLSGEALPSPGDDPEIGPGSGGSSIREVIVGHGHHNP